MWREIRSDGHNIRHKVKLKMLTIKSKLKGEMLSHLQHLHNEEGM